MNPKDFDWQENQQITVTNPTAKPFTWQVHSKKYTLEAGQSASMPGYLAWVYVYGQASIAAQQEGEWSQWNDLPVRQRFYERFVAGIQPIIQTVEIEKTLVEPIVDDSDELPTGGETYEPTQQSVSSRKAGKHAKKSTAV